MNDKVVILGTAPTIKDAPFNDPSYDIWGTAHVCFLQECTRVDELFEIHLEEIWRKDNAPFKRFPNAKIWMQKKYDDIPNSEAYPLDEVRKRFKLNKGTKDETDYYSTGIAYMICLAIMRGYKRIELFGVHLLMDEEYFYQRPCVEYYLGIATGMGIDVYVPPGAEILKFTHLYGYQDVDVEVKKVLERIKDFDTRGQQLAMQKAQALQQLDAQINQLAGAREQCYFQLRTMGKESRKAPLGWG